MDTKKRTTQIAGAGVCVAIGLSYAIYSYHERTHTYPGAALFNARNVDPLERTRMELIRANDLYIDLTENKDPSPEGQAAAQELVTKVKKMEEQVAAMNAKNASSPASQFVTLASRCSIDGYDANLIDTTTNGIVHVPHNAQLDPLRARARDLIVQNPEMNIRVLVFSDKIQMVDEAGKLIREDKVTNP